jgi:hypothetical protein
MLVMVFRCARMGYLTLRSGTAGSGMRWLLDNFDEVGQCPSLLGDPLEARIAALYTHRGRQLRHLGIAGLVVPHGCCGEPVAGLEEFAGESLNESTTPESLFSATISQWRRRQYRVDERYHASWCK